MDRQFQTDPEEKYQTIIELLSGIYIQITRSYDMLCLIGDKLGADTVKLSKEHANGQLLAPDPWIRNDDEQDDDADSDPVQPDTADYQVL
jgi:hypothetical protein